MTMKNQTPDAVVAQLQKELSAMLDPLDIDRSWTGRQLNAYEEKRATVTRRIYAIQSATSTLAGLPPLDAQMEWKNHLVEWRKKLVDELDTLPQPRTPKEHGERQNLELSIQTIDTGLPSGTGRSPETLRLGALMRASGYIAEPATDGRIFGFLPWFGSMPEVEFRIKKLTKRRDEAQAQLDDALLSDADREAKAKEDAILRAALNARPTRKTRGDGTQYDKYPDGRMVEVTS